MSQTNREFFPIILPSSLISKSSVSSLYGTFQTVDRTNWKILPKRKFELKLQCRPIQCPLTCCRNPVLISDVSKHFMEHNAITTAGIERGQRLRIQFKTKWTTKNKIESNLCLLLKGYVNDLGHEYKQYLPITLLYTRKKDTKHNGGGDNNQIENDILIFWLAGLTSVDHPVYVSMAIYFNDVPKRSLSCEVLSLHDTQMAEVAIKSGHCFWMTMDEVQKLTANGKKPLEMEICVL